MKEFTNDILVIKNTLDEVERITSKLSNDMQHLLKRRGAIVGISGGIDSSVCLALSVKAFGADKVLGILLPEKDSNSDSKDLALKLAEKFGIETIEENKLKEYRLTN